MKREIIITADKDSLTITVPTALLVFAAESSENFEGCTINDDLEFTKEVAHQIAGSYYDNSTGLTKFQMLLDECFLKVLESGTECISDIKD